MILLTLASFLFAQDVQSKPTESTLYERVNGWAVFRNTGSCRMVSVFNDDTSLSVDLDVRRNESFLTFVDPSIKSLKEGDTREIDIFFMEPKYDDGWGKKKFSVGITESGSAIFSVFLDDEIVTDIAKYKTLAFFYRERLVQSFPLEGSAKVVEALRRCAHDERRRNPSDPFE